MTKMILGERDIDCQQTQGNSPRAGKMLAGYRHTLCILMEQLRSRLGAGSEQLRVCLQYTMMLVLMLVLGSTGAWADDYSGAYYIGGPGWNNSTPTDNYYLCPTESWLYYVPTNRYGTSDNGQPFMTTYQCRNGEYDADNAVWIIEKHPTQDYYYIIHAVDGKYLTYNGQINNNNDNKKANIGRIRVHLEDSPTGDDALFEIRQVDTWYEFISKGATSRDESQCWLNVTAGNKPNLEGVAGKNDGPDGRLVGGTIGLWKTGGLPTATEKQGDANSKWYIEPVDVAPPSFSVNASGDVAISPISGATIYYTTDGSDPKTSGTKIAYSTAITASAIADANWTVIKAVAVDNADNTKVSIVIQKNIVNYTYHMVNRANGLSLNASKKQAVGTPISGTASIPSTIVSPYLTISPEETITFYSFDGAFSDSELTDENIITKTTTEANIYVKYTVDHLMHDSRFLHLRGIRPFNMQIAGGNFIYDDGTDLQQTTENLTDNNRLWYIKGNDPYAVQVRNAQTGRYLTSSTTLSDSPTTFVLTACSSVDASHETITLSNGSTTITATVNSVAISKYYYLIDKAGKLIEGISSPSSELLELPTDWQSPLVSTYHYWNAATVTDGTYTCTDEITDITGSTEDNIYVTYDVNNEIDLTGGTTYMLRFLNGQEFRQEDGKDGVLPADEPIEGKRKAVYPYNNGDFSLYVYGDWRWNQQLESGASERSRWLWYIVSSRNGTPLTDNDIDPYHVVVKSYQNQKIKIATDVFKDGNTYLYTYKPSDYSQVVTSVIPRNPDYTGTKPNIDPTEYMILGTSISNMTLMTVNPVDDGDGNPANDVRQTVNSFEQYWKNNPTVQKLEGQNPAADNAILTGTYGWHRYTAWAYSAAWGDDASAKSLAEGYHWFQTISMGDGSFTVEPVNLQPQVILLDQHGWEIMRMPLYSDNNFTVVNDELKKYNSPMVDEYHWYPTAVKTTGYHKYTISNPEENNIKVYNNKSNK